MTRVHDALNLCLNVCKCGLLLEPTQFAVVLLITSGSPQSLQAEAKQIGTGVPVWYFHHGDQNYPAAGEIQSFTWG